MRRVLLSRGEHARHEGCGMNVKRERKRDRLNPDKGLVGIASFNCIPSPWLFIVRICEREKRRGKKKVGRKRVARSHIKPLYEGKSSCLSWLNHGLKLLKVSERGVRVSRILEAIPFFLSLSFGHFNAHWNLTFQPSLSCPSPRQLYIHIHISVPRNKSCGEKIRRITNVSATLPSIPLGSLSLCISLWRTPVDLNTEPRRKRRRLSPRPERIPAVALYLSVRYGNYTDGN